MPKKLVSLLVFANLILVLLVFFPRLVIAACYTDWRIDPWGCDGTNGGCSDNANGWVAWDCRSGTGWQEGGHCDPGEKACNNPPPTCTTGYCYTANLQAFVTGNTCSPCSTAGNNFEWCVQNNNSIACHYDDWLNPPCNNQGPGGVNCSQWRCEFQSAQPNCNGITGCQWVDTTNQCAPGQTCNPSTSTCLNGCGSTVGCIPPCISSNPQLITSPSPVNTAINQPLSVSLTFPYNFSTFNWGTKCPVPNNDSFTFYLDTNANPTTIKCTNGPSMNPTSISNSCSATGLSYNTTYYWKVAASNGGTSTTSGPWSFTTQNPPAWWQVKDADVITGGAIQSTIPSASLYFGLNGLGGYHGIPTYGTTASFGSGAVSQAPTWLANTTTNYRKTYNYAFFKGQIPSDVQANMVEINSTSVAGSTFASGGTAVRGYVWYHFNGSLGDLTIISDVALGSRKVVLLIEGADLNINGKINLTKGSGFFMVVIGKNSLGSKGNIIVGPSVAGSPSLEGIYLAENQFKTGVGATQLNIRGSVASYGGVVLERNLGASNSTTPAEVFEYAPDLMVLYPNVFTDRRIRWKEVAP